jgi:hypothetical protein
LGGTSNFKRYGSKRETKMTSKYCEQFTESSEYIFKWLEGQPSVGEESITDWLLYNLSVHLPQLKYKKFTRHEEARKTGADWEWWFVDSNNALSLRIQAKKISKDKDNYNGLAHTNRYGLQIEKLIEDARRRNSLPFYSLYFAPNGSPIVRCGGDPDAGRGHGTFLAGALELYSKYIKGGRSKVDAIELLKNSNPLSCLVCCRNYGPNMPDGVDSIYSYLRDYYPENIKSLNIDSDTPGLHKDAPNYVHHLMKLEGSEIPDWWESEFAHEIEGVNSILVVDLTASHNKTLQQTA